MRDASSPRGPGFAPVPAASGTPGSALHRRALAVAFGGRGHGDRQSRPWHLDALRRLKLHYIVRQRSFPARLANYLRYRRESGRVARAGYFPVVIGFEVFGRCNLQCPGCPTGLRLPEGRRKKAATLETALSVIEEASPKALQISFHRQGEPLLNPVFFSACADAVRRGLWTVTHVNLSHDRRDLAEDICDSGLHNLVVSCDGATQETYEAYRKRGNLELVFENVRRIARRKRTRGTPYPWITMKFIVFDHNWHEVEAFRSRAVEAGADDVLFVSAFSSASDRSGRAADDHEFDLETLTWRRREFGPCHYVWEALELDYDGAVLPCCWAHTDDHLFVSREAAARMSLMERWNSPDYVATRAYFIGEGSRADLHPMCRTCELVEQHARREAQRPARQRSASRARRAAAT